MKREMNREEEITEAYLKSLGFKDVVFEPDGNITPDFSIDGRIAVEVRRLNQHFFTKDEVRGLEETKIPLFKLLESSLSEFDSQYKGCSYWVFIRFHRPVEKGNANKKAIVKALTDFLSRPFPLPCDVKVTENIYFHIYPSQAVEGKVFRFAGGTDRESGGWVLAEFKKNFDHCIEEKTEKIKDHYDKYDLRWLVLVDKIVHGFDESEKEQMKSMVSMNPSWDKVIILDSLSGNNVLEIQQDGCRRQGVHSMDQIVRVGTINVNLSPDAFHMSATHYYKCKQDFQCPNKFSPVPYFLLCRSIELELKSVHLKHKRQQQVKEEFSHDLIKSYEALDPVDQLLSANERDVLEKANDIYKGKGFEYFVPIDALTAYSYYPGLEDLDSIAKKLLDAAARRGQREGC